MKKLLVESCSHSSAALRQVNMAPVSPRKEFVCDKCSKSFLRECYYNKHVETQACSKSRFSCTLCSSRFNRACNLTRHLKVMHPNSDVAREVFVCGLCEERFFNVEHLRQHRQEHFDKNRKEESEFHVVETAHKRHCERHRVVFPESVSFIPQAFSYLYKRLLKFLKFKQFQHRMFKFALIVQIEMIKLDERGDVENIIVVPFRSETHKVFPFTTLSPLVLQSFFKIDTTLDHYLHLGSGWTVNELMFADVETVKCLPISGSCGMHQVRFVRKRGVIFGNEGFEAAASKQLDSEDLLSSEEFELLLQCNANPQQSKYILPARAQESCFYLSVAQHFTKTCTEAKAFVANFKCNLKLPVVLEDIPQFERDNAVHELSINVLFRDSDSKTYPVYVSKNFMAKNVITLLLCFTENGNLTDHHYAYVKDPADLLAPREQNKSRKRSNGYFCHSCMNFVYLRSSYLRHIKWCSTKTGQYVHMPLPGDTISFKSGGMKTDTPFVICFDFESMTVASQRSCSCSDEVIEFTEREQWKKTLGEREYISCLIDEDLEEQFGNMREDGAVCPKKRRKKLRVCPHKTKTLYEQHVISYALVMTNREHEVIEQKYYMGYDAAEHFLKTILELEAKWIGYLINGGKKMELTQRQRKVIELTVDCSLCGKELGGDRVRHHDHISGKFLGVVHNSCNLRAREDLRIVVFALNFSGYDSHPLIKVLDKCKDQIWKMNAICYNTQRVKMLNINSLIFLDSLAFLADSLEKLVETLVVSSHNFPILKQRLWKNILTDDGFVPSTGCVDEQEKQCIKLLLRKGVYPYGYVSSIEKLYETKTLPPIEAFFRDIGEEHISPQDYAHAQKVWDAFGCKNLADFTQVYNLSDSYLLSECILNLRKVIMDEFQIDVTKYLSLPMVAKSVMLKTTQVEIELISDQEMSHMLQSNIRGGVSYINTRYVDVEKLSKAAGFPLSATYIDANNL